VLDFSGREMLLLEEDVSHNSPLADLPSVLYDVNQGLPDKVTDTAHEDDLQKEAGAKNPGLGTPGPSPTVGKNEIEGDRARPIVDVHSGAGRNHSIYETVFLRAEAMPEKEMKVNSPNPVHLPNKLLHRKQVSSFLWERRVQRNSIGVEQPKL